MWVYMYIDVYIYTCRHVHTHLQKQNKQQKCCSSWLNTHDLATLGHYPKTSTKPKGLLTCGKCNWSPSLGMGCRDGVWSSCMLNKDARADWAARAFASFLFLPEPSKVCPSTATAITKFLAWLSPLSERNSYFSPGRSSFRIMTGFFPLAEG